jgi:calcium-dependent protein kinase
LIVYIVLKYFYLLIPNSFFSDDGEISFGEFRKVMAKQFNKKYTRTEIKTAFCYFDKDNSGFISVKELDEALLCLGKSYSKEELENIIKKIDYDSNGMISIDEFTNLLNS